MRGDADRQDTGQTHRTEWRVRPAGPSDRAFMLGITPRLAQGFELPSWRSAGEVVAAESATLDAALRPGADQGAVLLAEEGGGVPGGYAYVRAETDYYGRTHAHIEILAVSQPPRAGVPEGRWSRRPKDGPARRGSTSSHSTYSPTTGGRGRSTSDLAMPPRRCTTRSH